MLEPYVVAEVVIREGVIVLVPNVRAQFATVVPGPLMTAEVVGGFSLEIEINQLLLHEVNPYPLAAAAVICIVEPALYQEVPEGDTVPPSLGELETAISYCVTKLICSLVWDRTFNDPELPVVTINCMPCFPDIGEETLQE